MWSGDTIHAVLELNVLSVVAVEHLFVEGPLLICLNRRKLPGGVRGQNDESIYGSLLLVVEEVGQASSMIMRIH